LINGKPVRKMQPVIEANEFEELPKCYSVNILMLEQPVIEALYYDE
jgi:hypothetical protein